MRRPGHTLAILAIIVLCCGCTGGGGDEGGSGSTGTASTTIFTDAVAPEGAVPFDETAGDGTRSRGYRLDGVLVGPFMSWHANGRKAAEGSYDGLGRREGWWHFWYDSGILEHEGHFAAGTLDTGRFWVRRGSDGAWIAGSVAP